MAKNNQRILYCHCAYARILPEEVKSAVLKGLTHSGVAFDAVADLCEMSARGDAGLQRIASGEAQTQIIACYPRAVKWLFSAAKAPIPDVGVEILNMRTQPAEDILEALDNGVMVNGDGPSENTKEGEDK